ncbi:MAG: FtsQ-type POTRA domain-containing protein [Actinobacteria bacterium]|nr:FtsQ-type POTRA domain-containing protein [Actinomycetota bacterium]
MSNSDDSKPSGEFVVSEVSNEVLDELSQLFGSDSTPSVSQAPESPDDDNVDTTTMLTSSGDVTAAGVEDESVSAVLEIVDESLDVSSPTPGPADPLIIEMRGDVFTGDDDAEAFVVISDSLDHVVIVDDDRPDPTFEDRRRKQERRERLQRVKWLKLAGVVVGAIVVVMAILASPLFAIRSVTLEGNVYTSKEVVEQVRDLLKGASVFTVDTGKARTILLDDPWVSDVRITTHFPSKALVEIAERVPVVWYVGTDQKVRVVDARGRVIVVLDGWPTKYLQVEGTGPSLDAGAVADDAYRAAAQLVLALPDEIRPKVASLALSPGGELSMTLKSGTVVRFGQPADLQNKLVLVVVLLRRQDPATLAVVDVSTGTATVKIR